MEFLNLPILMALWIFSEAKYTDPSCVVKVSDSIHDAVFSHNNELSLRLWYWASPSQTMNYTIRTPSPDPDQAQTYHMKTNPSQNDTTWIKVEVGWPRPATNLSIITAGAGEKLNEKPSTTSSLHRDSYQESNTPQGLHITSDYLLIWLNTNPQHLNEEHCQEAVFIVNHLLGSNESIPSYTSEAVHSTSQDWNSRKYDKQTPIIVILSIFLVGALLSLAAICCYIRQQTPQPTAQYESVEFGGPGLWRESTGVWRDDTLTDVAEEIPQKH